MVNTSQLPPFPSALANLLRGHELVRGRGPDHLLVGDRPVVGGGGRGGGPRGRGGGAVGPLGRRAGEAEPYVRAERVGDALQDHGPWDRNKEGKNEADN